MIEDGKPILMTDGLPLVNRTPILDMDTWQALQDELSRRANPGDRRREGTSLLRGIVYCAVCQNRMYTYIAKGRTRYRCIGRLKARQSGVENGCYGVSIAGEGMEQHVTDRFLTAFGGLAVVRMVEHVGEDFRPQVRQAREALEELEKDRYDRGLFKGEEGSQRYAAQYSKLEERLESLNEKQRHAKPAGVEEIPTGHTHAQLWHGADTAGKRDLLLNAGAYVEVGMSRKGGPRLDTSRLVIHFGVDGEIRRADADGKDVEAVIQQAVARDLELF